jgi:hypothetical protein
MVKTNNKIFNIISKNMKIILIQIKIKIINQIYQIKIFKFIITKKLLINLWMLRMIFNLINKIYRQKIQIKIQKKMKLFKKIHNF